MEPGSAVRSGRPTVVFFGDSRAASWPPPPLPQFSFVNRGMDGETSAEALRRFDHDLRPLRPEFVVLQSGVNDLTMIATWRGHKKAIVAGCQENLHQIVAGSVRLGARVLLTTIFAGGQVPPEIRPYWPDSIPAAIVEVNAFLRSLEGNGVVVLDSYAALVGEDGCTRAEYSQDLLHLNAAGYRRLNEELVPLLSAMSDQ
jgi:lysophospholipase L1-like esterase